MWEGSCVVKWQSTVQFRSWAKPSAAKLHKWGAVVKQDLGRRKLKSSHDSHKSKKKTKETGCWPAPLGRGSWPVQRTIRRKVRSHCSIATASASSWRNCSMFIRKSGPAQVHLPTTMRFDWPASGGSACTFACLHVCMFACLHVCMIASLHVCMYARRLHGLMDGRMDGCWKQKASRKALNGSKYMRMTSDPWKGPWSMGVCKIGCLAACAHACMHLPYIFLADPTRSDPKRCLV